MGSGAHLLQASFCVYAVFVNETPDLPHPGTHRAGAAGTAGAAVAKWQTSSVAFYYLEWS